ncbi:metabotropic glutamate receptor 7-like [Babylonia areolata]|uniref:metabotropic glutamate receptor 7-like n=1 Tax=Babylonia areolata TaxID=304850 RepID=UPI003FD15755
MPDSRVVPTPGMLMSGLRSRVMVMMLVWRLVQVAAFPQDIFDPHFQTARPGDVSLGVIVSVHTNVGGRCSQGTTMSLSAVEFLEAVLFSVDQVNRDQVIPGVTLGVHVLDDCFSASLALMRALQFMPRTVSRHTHPAQELPFNINSQRDHAHLKRTSSPATHAFFTKHTSVSDNLAESYSSSPATARWTRKPLHDAMETTDRTRSPLNSTNSNTVAHLGNVTVYPSGRPSEFQQTFRHPFTNHSEPRLESSEPAPPSSQLNVEDESRLAKTRMSGVRNVSGVRSSNSGSKMSGPGPQQMPPFFEVAGVIGAFTSQHTIEVAKVLQLFELPQISPSATSDVLSDKQRFPYFLRTVPPDRDQVKAMGQLVRHFNWTYVSLVYSEDAYGHGSQARLADTLHSLDVCVAQTLTLSAAMKSSHYDDVIRALRRHRRARVVLLYADVKHLRPLMEAVERNGAAREFIWVGSDSLYTELQHNPHMCHVNLGSITVKARAVTPPAFLQHMTDKIQRRHLATVHDNLESWEMPPDLLRLTATQVSDHTLLPTLTPLPHMSSTRSTNAQTTNIHKAGSENMVNSGDHMFHNHTPHHQQSHIFGIAAFVIDSVYAFTYAIKALLKDHCPRARGPQVRECLRRHKLHPYLQRLRFNGTSGVFEFDENGDAVGAVEVRQCQVTTGKNVQNEQIGIWEHRDEVLNVQRAHFLAQDASVPSSVCAELCGSGQIYSFTRQTCCWSCVTCKVNEITTANASGCVPCPLYQWPEHTSRLRCVNITVPPTTTHPVVALALQVAAVVGLMMTSVTAFTFCLYRGQRVIRSSSRELSGVMLGGLTASYLLVFPLLATPTPLSCYVTHVGFGLTFTLVYAPLLVKTHRIFRIFRAGRQSAALPRCTSSASQLGITTVLISVQMVIVTISTAVDPPSAVLHQPLTTQPRVERLCLLPVSGLGASLAYHFLLVLLCTLLAFKTRRLPDNYNESRYIAFCVDTTLLVWVTFVPAYFTATVGAHKVVVLALTHLINSCVQLACLFLPRLYALYRQNRQPSGASDSGSKLGSYGLLPVRGVDSKPGLGSSLVDNKSGSGDGVKPGSFVSGSNGQVSVSEVMGSNTLSIADSSVVVWEYKDEEQVTDTAAV